MKINQSTNNNEVESNVKLASSSLKETPITEIVNTESMRNEQDSRFLIGSVVTKAGKVRIQNATEEDIATLTKLRLQPYFVGFDSEFIEKAINGNISEIRKYISRELSFQKQTFFNPNWENQENWIPHPYNLEMRRNLYSPSDHILNQESDPFGSVGPRFCNANGWTFPLGTGQYRIDTKIMGR